MKIGLIKKNDKKNICLIQNEKVILLEKAFEKYKKKITPSPLFAHLFSSPIIFIKNFPALKKSLKKLLSLTLNEKINHEYILPLSRVKMLAPIPQPGTVYCIARNYTEHILEFQEKIMEQDKMVPALFIKPNTCVTGPGGPLLLPKTGQKIDWEAELAVIIGKKGKYISKENALKHVFGYTCMMDISERNLKIRNRTEDRGRDKFFDWLNGKWMDTFAPQGPWMVTEDEIDNHQSLGISLTVNGIEKQNGNTAQMIFNIVDLISYLSQIVTLMPGDLISTGTPSGVGAPHETFLKNNDIVEMKIDKIGKLQIKVKKERK